MSRLRVPEVVGESTLRIFGELMSYVPNTRSAFVQCAACHCHIKRAERHCPFCNARVEDVRASATPRTSRVSRAAWMALGSSLAALGTAGFQAGCQTASTTHDPGPLVDGPATGSEAPIGADAAVQDADAGTCSAGASTSNGTIRCGVTRCNAETQYCEHDIGDSCSPGSSDTHHTDQTTCRDKTPDGGDSSFPAECLVCSTCACVAPLRLLWDRSGDYVRDAWTCKDLEGGGVLITDEFFSCGPCYGAPPSRLERLLS
jgi:hypothetical protein